MLPVDADRELFRMGPDEITVLATSAQSGGALFAVQVRMPPGGGPPGMHRHAPGEVSLVLEREFTFYEGPGESVRRTPARVGDVVTLAGGTARSIRNESDADAVAFVVHAPGPPMEGFSRAAAALAARGDASMDDVLAIAAEHGIELLGSVPEVAAPAQ